MPAPLLFDLSKIELNKEPVFDKQQILSVNPQNHEMQQLDGVLWFEKQERLVLGYKDLTDNEFWVRGHIPGRPVMPGVIMVESAAQLLSFFVRKVYGVKGFVGFLGIESAKFRAQVAPGKRLYLLGKITKFGTRKFTAYIQGVVDGKMVFETEVSGMQI